MDPKDGAALDDDVNVDAATGGAQAETLTKPAGSRGVLGPLCELALSKFVKTSLNWLWTLWEAPVIESTTAMDRTAASDEERAANKNGNVLCLHSSVVRSKTPQRLRGRPKAARGFEGVHDWIPGQTFGLERQCRVVPSERKAQALSSGSVCRSSTKEPGPKYLGYTLPPRLFPTLQYGRRTKFHKPSLDGALKQVSSDGGHSTPASRPVESKVRSAEPSALEGTSAAPVVIDTAISAAGAGAGAGSAAAAKTLSD
ncbi:hypothetical protein EDD21DRAFT_448940 [Dissophora ornata]|nr:hypothetical protein EDD21DRAFT_448940 [Dissophora ornata]